LQRLQLALSIVNFRPTPHDFGLCDGSSCSPRSYLTWGEQQPSNLGERDEKQLFP